MPLNLSPKSSCKHGLNPESEDTPWSYRYCHAGLRYVHGINYSTRGSSWERDALCISRVLSGSWWWQPSWLVTGIVGIPCTSMCTCSSETPISKNRISCFCSISKQISLKLSSTSGVKICLLYFTGNTAGGFCVHAHSSRQYITFLDSKGVKDTANNWSCGAPRKSSV